MKCNPVIVAVGYNRIDALARLLNSIEGAYYEKNEVTLIISLDYGGGDDIVNFANRFVWTHGKKIVRTFNENQGLKKHIISCGDYSLEYGAAIILEDDLFVSPYFYSYVCEALEYYREDENIFGIALYSQRWNGFANRVFEPIHDGYDAYFSQVACSWGQCFIGKQWEQFKEWYATHEHNLSAEIDVPYPVTTWKHSQGKYISYYIAEKNKYFLTPYESLSTNFHESGIHVKLANSTYQVPLLYCVQKFRFPEFKEALKYDNYFESIILKEILKENYPNKRICIDFYGMHRNSEKYDLCLCSGVRPYQVIKSWGLKMKPYELNCIYDIKGDDIFLYDMNKPLYRRIKERKTHHYNWIQYEVRDLHWIDALFYVLYIWWGRIKNFFHR